MNFWYKKRAGWKSGVLYPLSFLVDKIARRRRRQRSKTPYPAPVIVVGNITVGGTGKTPMICYLLALLKKNNYRVGIVSRGYGALSTVERPLQVNISHSWKDVGDEALMIFKKTGAPVYVCTDRDSAVNTLLAEHAVDVVISDDGMQHYSMYRDIEILMIDGERGLGNGKLLPSGPLREPLDRVKEVDFIVAKNQALALSCPLDAVATLEVSVPINKSNTPLEQLDIVAMTAIGNPDSFFHTLSQRYRIVKKASYPDHKPLPMEKVLKSKTAVVVTEKDWIKFQDPPEHLYYLPIEFKLNDSFDNQLLKKLISVKNEESHHHPSQI